MANHISLNRKTFKNDEDVNIDGFFEPIFYNIGDEEVTINGVSIPQNGSYSAAFTGAFSYGRVSIKFGSVGGTKNVLLVYGMPKNLDC